MNNTVLQYSRPKNDYLILKYFSLFLFFTFFIVPTDVFAFGNNTCTTNEDCHDPDTFCNYPGPEECRDPSTLSYTDYTGYCQPIGPIIQTEHYTISRKVMSWWAADNWCKAQGKSLALNPITDGYFSDTFDPKDCPISFKPSLEVLLQLQPKGTTVATWSKDYVDSVCTDNLQPVSLSPQTLAILQELSGVGIGWLSRLYVNYPQENTTCKKVILDFTDGLSAGLSNYINLVRPASNVIIPESSPIIGISVPLCE